MKMNMSLSNKPMNILVTLDSNYVYPLTVMLSSLMRSNPYERFNLYVAHSSLTREDFYAIDAAVDSARCRVMPMRVSAEMLVNAPVLDRITHETYYRLLAPEYLPKSVDRVLYIDPDTVVINPLRGIYYMDFEGELIIGSSHVSPFLNFVNRIRLHMAKDSKYINAGVMLMNIEGLRKSTTSAEIFDYISSRGSSLYLADQDVINGMFSAGTRLIAPEVFNLDEKTYKTAEEKGEIDMNWVKENCAIIHYNGEYKPWKPGYRGVLKPFFDHEVARMRERRRAV